MISLLLWALLLVGGSEAFCPKKPWPMVTLPWGSVQPTDCIEYLTWDMFVFKNVRFGKATDGSQGGSPRFGPPSFPDPVSNPSGVILDQSSGPACIQVDWTGGPNCSASNGRPPDYGGPILGPGKGTVQAMSEDCLFLDVYAPVSAVTQKQKLPVIAWIYGGAYLFGSKDFGAETGLPFYSGQGLVEAGKAVGNGVVFVAGNYRLAQLGWLAGTTVSGYDQTQTIPNAGLEDQRLMLQFVQNNIAGFGGDPASVTVFGESAGAGSILHHLVATNGDGSGKPRNPLFQQAVMQSAAFQWIWDGSKGGTMDQAFANFVSLVPSCRSTAGIKSLVCLKSVGSAELATAVGEFWTQNKCSGVWNIGPVVDGKFVTQLPSLTLESPGFSFYPTFKQLISSHVAEEAPGFVPSYVNDTSGFAQLLLSFIPGGSANSTAQRQCITQRYCAGLSCASQRAAAIQMVQDSMFVCNVRYLYDAASRQSMSAYEMAYSVFGQDGLATHGSDLIPTFWNKDQTDGPVIDMFCNSSTIKDCRTKARLAVTAIKSLRDAYQQYFASFAIHGYPGFGKSQSQQWVPAVNQAGTLGLVLQVTAGSNTFQNISDPLTTASTCGFWACIAQAVTQGYAPTKCCTSSKGGFDAGFGRDELR